MQLYKKLTNLINLNIKSKKEADNNKRGLRASFFIIGLIAGVTAGVFFATNQGWIKPAFALVDLWIESGANIYNANTGNVGIGTASPSTKLHALVNDATASSVTDVLTVTHTTTGTMSKFNPDTNGTLGTSLIGYWKLEETSGTRVDSAEANDLSDINTVTSNPAGKQGNAAQFTSANSKNLEIADNADLSTGDIDFTWAGWVYFDSNNTETLASKYTSSGDELGWLLIYYGASTQRIQFEIYNTGAGTTSTAPVQTLTTGTWYFIVAWHNAIADTINVSINNATSGNNGFSSNATEGVFPADSNDKFALGAMVWGGTHVNFLNGRLDEVGFWKKALTAQERTDLYNSGNGNTCTDDCNNYDSGIGTGIVFQAEDAASNTENVGRISSILTNTNNGSETSALIFGTRTAGGSLTERMRIDGSGNVGIGTANPSAKLEVQGGVIKAGGGFIIEVRTSDPPSPVTGQMWLITQ